ncbi:nucleolin-like [Ceratina calcarata]|uniref:Nucleolin-like n=1 Tax=Ceratina calcarata TaxID=156304 RepID=A0AAJ7IRQ1_9HYME|nr:nucleolin-like [Ceratina calcarata]
MVQVGMPKNTKKRSASDSNPIEKKPPGNLSKDAKKKKTESVAVQNGQTKKQIKKDMPKKLNKEKNVGLPEGSKKQTNEGKPQKTAEEKLALLKSRQEQREKRKENRVKNRGLQIDLTPEEIKKKIKEIEKRQSLTKSAKRKLASLRKKLSVLEGTDVSKDGKIKQEVKVKNEKSVEGAKKKQAVQKKNAQGKLGTKSVKQNEKNGTVKKGKKEEKEEEDDDDDDDDDDNLEMDDESDGDEDESNMEDEDEEEDDENDDEEDNAVKQEVTNQKDVQENKKRYVLFVGNLPYTATPEEIKKHFLTKVSEVANIRIPKRDDNKPRGFAYVELNNSTDYEKGLALNHSFISGRRINVQYSAPNKKEGVAKNFKMHALQKAGMLAGGKRKAFSMAGGKKNQNRRPTKA